MAGVKEKPKGKPPLKTMKGESAKKNQPREASESTIGAKFVALLTRGALRLA